MDWGDDPQLLRIFQEEVLERTARLVEGGRRLGRAPLTAEELTALARDAHTIKGSARVMRFTQIGAAAELLERTWKDLQGGGRDPSVELGDALADAAESIGAAMGAGPSGAHGGLAAAMERLRATLGLPPAEPSVSSRPDGPGTLARHPHRASEPPAPGPTASTPTAGDPATADRSSGGPSLEPGADLATDVDLETLGVPVDLGGLLRSIQKDLDEGVTRVDTATLYELINRIVEIRLDVDALVDRTRALRHGDARFATADARRWLAAVERVDRDLTSMQEQALALVAVPLRTITDTFPQLVRYLARRAGKEVRFELQDEDVRVDRQIVDSIREPLRHLIVNAIDHGIQTPEARVAVDKAPTGTVAVRAAIHDHRLVVTVEDDGRGIDWDAVRDRAVDLGILDVDETADRSRLAEILFTPGFSTVTGAIETSGDGSGLAALAEIATLFNGGVHIESEPGHGTSIVLTLPASIAMQEVLLVSAGDHRWGIPLASVLAHMPVATGEVRPDGDRMKLLYQGDLVPLASFAATVGVDEAEPVSELVVLTTRTGVVAVAVPRVVGRRQVAVKSLGPALAGAPHISGAALLGGGEAVTIVEPNRLAERVRDLPAPLSRRPRVLVVDDSKGVRQLVAATLTSQGYEATVAGDATAALEALAGGRFDALVVDYAMPGRDGVELVAEVRRSDPGLPIVMLSAVAGADDQARAREAGVDAYLDKYDLRQGVLFSTLRSLLEARGAPVPEVRT